MFEVKTILEFKNVNDEFDYLSIGDYATIYIDNYFYKGMIIDLNKEMVRIKDGVKYKEI